MTPTTIKIAVVLALLGACAGVWYAISQTYVRAYVAGESAGKAVIQSKLDKAQAEANLARMEYENRIAIADAALKEQAVISAQALASAVASAAAMRTKVQGAVRANPKYASVERPAELQRVRADAFAELEQATSRGSKLSGAGVSSLPAASDGKRPDPRDK